jgi:hypothetical protein
VVRDIIFSLVIGGTVGVIGHVRKHGKIIMPRKTKKFLYLGFFEDMLLGSVTAILWVLYTTPNTLVENILYSTIAGIGGDTILSKIKVLKENGEE